MALNPKEQAEYNRLIKEGIELAEKLGDAASKINFQSMPDSLKASNPEFIKVFSLVSSLKKEWEDFTKNVSNAHQSFIHIVEEIKNTYKGINLTNNAFNGLASIGQKIVNIQQNVNSLSSKELNSLKEKVNAKVEELKTASDILSRDKESILNQIKSKSITDEERKSLRLKYVDMLFAERKINEELSSGKKNHEALIEAIDKEIDKVEKLKNKIGLTGAIIKGISKIPILGDIIDTDKALEAAKSKGKESNSSKLDTMKAAIKSVKGDIKEALLDPLTISISLGTAFIKTLSSVDEQTGNLAKNFNLTYKEASDLRTELISIANSTGDINVNTKGLQESLTVVGNTLGSNAVLNKGDLIIFTKLREQAGLTNDELTAMEKLTLATKTNLEDNVKNTLAAAKETALNNGVLLNEKQIMSEVAKASNSIKLSLANNPESLARAVAQAKALGLSLEEVDKIAESLLNFESSITSELEAELLTGKELNLEQARLYAINNDMEGLSKEIAKNFGSAAEFSKMNRIQQEAAAKAVGMSREELASTLTDQEALRNLSGEQAEKAKEALALARSQGISEEEIKKKGIDGLLKQQSVQERLNASVEKLKELFVSLTQPLLPVLDTLSSVLGIVGMILKPVGLVLDFFGRIGEAISKTLGPLGAMGSLLKGAAGIAIILAAYKAYASLATIPVLGVPLGIAAAAAVTATGFSLLDKIKTANDLVNNPPGYGKRTLMGPEGAIALNDKDTIIAGTKLFGEDKSNSLGREKSNFEKVEIKPQIEIPNNKEITKISDSKFELIKETEKLNQDISNKSSQNNIDIIPIIQELKEVKSILSKILSKEGAVYLDSSKVGSTLNVGSSQIQ